MSSIERVGLEGASLMAALQAACFDRPWSEAEMAGFLGSFGVQGVIVSVEGEPAGHALIRTIAGVAEILTLGVIPGQRGAGLGARLVEACCDAARDVNARQIFLEVSEPNASARKIYANAGFSQIGRREAYYRDGSTALVLGLDL